MDTTKSNISLLGKAYCRKKYCRRTKNWGPPVLNSIGAPCFRRAGDDPIPPVKKKFSASKIRVN
jgi:hypothetical protein